ncbi:DUF262 domain-containing HNH endonuclease family protein [Microbulbifer sp. MKSA007]|nr:DUF262 domain-containing HNH endonuclease family protein [Microbulbifer sp. MKSA007]
MEAKECKIQDILTENKRFIIPPYQRPYSWNQDNAEQLIDDIIQSYMSDETEYFIGSMICISQGQNSFEVVDGQQRLTTLSLIVSQLKRQIDHQGVKDDLQKRILPIDVYSDETDEPRLVVRSKELPLYKHYILQNKAEYLPEKPTDTELLFIENQKIIGNVLNSYGESELKNIAKYILHNVYVVFVQTNDVASSFRLFNVLNNRGLPLSNADLLKNNLFESARTQNKDSSQVEDAWAEIEDLVGVSRLDKFLTLHKFSEKKDRDRVVQKGLDSFTASLADEFKSDAVEMSLALLSSAKNYTKILDIDFDDYGLVRRITSLSQLSNDEWMPPLVAFLNRISRYGDLDKEQFSQFVEVFEKAYMQGWIKKQVKSQREMVCYSALVAINNRHSFEEILEFIRAHADNDGFITALDSELYEPRPNQVNLIKAILLRYDAEQQDISVTKTYNGRITIEHILPQKLSNDYWHSRFNSKEHSEWLHKLGNLTLISGSKNSEAQNSDFIKKKAIYEKLNSKSSFDITRDICKIDEWNLTTLKQRHENMKSELISLWVV